MKPLDLVILGDLHYVGPGGTPRTNSRISFRAGLELGCRAVRDALRTGRPDAILVMGDIVDRGSAPGALDDWREVHAALARFDIPILAVPGNHDDFPEQVQCLFGCDRGVHELNGYLFLTFADHFAPGTEVPSRPPEQMAVLREVRGGGRPVIALQHAVILPTIDCRSYPYNFPAAVELARSYAEAGVFLSISGHYHAGCLPPPVVEGVTYLVCPCLSEAPFAYTRLRLEGSRVASLERIPLSLAGVQGLHDFHIHTEFAYCATDIRVEGALERAALLGIPTVGLLEHADHLYLPREGFWKRTDSTDPRALGRGLADGHARHEAFRRRVRPFRSDRVRLGLEVEPSSDGHGLAILDDDRLGYDYLLGAVHSFGALDETELSEKELDGLFLSATRQLLDSGVDILAHPFRYYTKKRRRAEPRALYRPVVELLAAHGTAAEINFHTYTPEPEFYALCLERGVRLSLGSDSHSLIEVGELRPHVELLRQLDALGRLDEVLWNPDRPAMGRAAGFRMS